MTDFVVTVNGDAAATITVDQDFGVEVKAGDTQLQTKLSDELTSEKEVFSGGADEDAAYDEVETLIAVDDPYALQMTLLGLPMQLSSLYARGTVIDVDGDWDIFTAGDGGDETTPIEPKHLPGKHDQMSHAGEPRGLTGDEKAWYEHSHAKHFGLSEASFGFILDRMSEQVKDVAHLVQEPGQKDAKYVLNTEAVAPGSKEFDIDAAGPDAARTLSGRLLEVMSGVFGGALTETLTSGKFPYEAWQYVESIIEPQIDPVVVLLPDDAKAIASWKHLPGQHDQTTHGRKTRDDVKDVPTEPVSYENFLTSLKWIADTGFSIGGRHTPEGMADKYGKEYPQGVEFTQEEQDQLLKVFADNPSIEQKAGECYHNAWDLMNAGRGNGLDFKYVEGYGDSMNFFPIGHAWVEWNGKPLDITWSDDITNPRRPKTPKALLRRITQNAKVNAYKGYTIPADYMYKYQARNGTYGPVVNDPENPAGNQSVLRSGILPWLKESGVQKHLPGQHDQQSHGSDPSNVINGASENFYSPAIATILRNDFAQKFGFIGMKKDVTVNGQTASIEIDGVMPTNNIYGSELKPQYNLIVKLGGKRYKAWAIDSRAKMSPGNWLFGSKATRRYGHQLKTPEELIQMMSNVIKKHLPGQHDQTTHAGDRTTAQKIPQHETPAFDVKAWAAMPIPDRRAAWEKLSQQEQDRLADPTHSILATQNQILAFAGARPQTGAPMDAVNQRLQSIGDLIMPDAHEKVKRNLSELSMHLKESGVDDNTSRQILLEATDVLAAQESESMARTLGDHGIRHVLGDSEMALQILEQVPGMDSPKAKAAVRIAAIFHDAGYMTEASKIFLDDSHPRWGGQHYEANIRPLVEKALGAETADHISYMIDTHAGTFLDWEHDPVSSALRVADNAALFQKEKLPGVFRYVPENIGVLEEVGKKAISVEEGKRQLMVNIGNANLPDKVKASLYRAGNEMNLTTPKYTLGMMGGEIDRFKWAPEHKAIDVFIHRNAEAKRLNNVLDLGQRQFGKWAETFGVNPKEFGLRDQFDFNFHGKTYLRTFVSGASLKSLIEKSGKMPIDDFFESMEYIEEPIDWSKLSDTEGGDPDGDIPVEKAGTRLGAQLGWEHRQIARKRQKEDIRRGWGRQKQRLQIQLDDAVRSRNAKQAEAIRARIASGDKVYATVKSLDLLITGKH